MTPTPRHRPARSRAAAAAPLASVALAALLLAALALPSCGRAPARRYFTLSYPLEPAGDAATRAPLHPVRLRVKPFGVALPYDRPQIVYRESHFQFGYYNYRLWAAKPQHMLRELVERTLQTERLAAEVSRSYGEEPPDYELGAEVLAMEEYDAGDVWYGHLAMRFELVRFTDRVPIWSYAFDRKRKVYVNEPVYVVRAISRIAEEELRRVAADLDAVISRERGVAPTLAAPAPSSDDAPPPPPADGSLRPLGPPEEKAPPPPEREGPPGGDDAREPIIDPDDQLLPPGPGAAP